MRIAILALAAMTTSGLVITQTPPIRMGLWETTDVTTTNMPAQMAESMKKAGVPSGVPVTVKRKSCITPETWEKAMGVLPPSSSCKITNRTATGRQIAMTLSCEVGKVAVATDIAITFDSMETWHGVGHTTSVFPPKMMGGGKSTSETRMKAAYISSSCGAVEPGKAVLER